MTKRQPRSRQLDPSRNRPDAHVLEHPVLHLAERRAHRLELAPDHLVERERVVVDALVDLLVDLLVPEDLGDRVEEVLLGDRAVEVDDRVLALKVLVTPQDLRARSRRRPRAGYA
jgi:hypothetical protein